MANLPLQFRLNGSDIAAFADEAENLLSVLRGRVADPTPKFGCGQGGCGACMVNVANFLSLEVTFENHAYCCQCLT